MGYADFEPATRHFVPSLEITARLRIDESELDERFVASSGPGGQNVNKVATAVQLRFDAARSQSITDAVCRRLRVLAGRRMSHDGVILIFAQSHRTQERNRADARERLTELIRAAASPPPPRFATRPTLASKRRRLEGKAARATVKRTRASPRQE